MYKKIKLSQSDRGYKARIFIIICFLFLTACGSGSQTKPMPIHEFTRLNPTCENVDKTIAYLAEHKAEHNNRTMYTIYATPAWAPYFKLKGEYDTVKEIATGEWEQAMDRKLRELCDLRMRCQESGIRHF